MARDRQAIEARFRSGSRWFLIIAALSALASLAFYQGIAWKALGMVSLATPLVLDTAVKTIGGRWLWAEDLQYYCLLLSLALAAVFLLIGVLTSYASHTGAFLKLDRVFGIFARLGGAFGMAHLVGSRLIYFVGVVLYVADGLLAFCLEFFLRNILTDLRVLVLTNLGFHCFVLVFLMYGLASGFEKENKPE